jgi:hypothetical protein
LGGDKSWGLHPHEWIMAAGMNLDNTLLKSLCVCGRGGTEDLGIEPKSPNMQAWTFCDTSCWVKLPSCRRGDLGREPAEFRED